tara:strand:- start:250 stop:525 length:276 start_codon:yes stop_codon:yes gene_type:complete
MNEEAFVAEDIKEKIVNLINESINPGLASHGGFVQLSDVIPYEDSWKITLDFMGGCHGCPSAVGSTLKSIEFFLREELDASTLIVESSAEL